MSPTVYTSRPGGTTRVQTAHFDTTRETSKSLGRPPYASASLNASSADSLRFYMPLRRHQSQSASCAPVALHSASGGDAHENRRAPYESPDDEDSACASDSAPPSLSPPLAGRRGAPCSTSPPVPGMSACLHHRPHPARRRDAPQRDKNRAP